MSLINHRRRSARWHGASQKVGQLADPLFLDRIDLQIDVVPVPIKDLSDAPAGESSEEIRKRVIAARQIQENRFKNCPGIHCNAQMTEKMLQQYATPTPEAAEQLRRAMERLQLSARAYSRILKVAAHSPTSSFSTMPTSNKSMPPHRKPSTASAPTCRNG